MSSHAPRRQDAQTAPIAVELPIYKRFERLPCVGREFELRAIQEAIQAAAAGHGRTLVIIGEAGGGKSRLIRETARIVGVSGGMAVSAESIPTTGAPPFDVWIRALRQFSSNDLPELLSNSEQHGADLNEAIADSARFRQFTQVFDELDRQSRKHLLMIGLDDLQWADRSSHGLLEFLSNRIGKSNIVLLAAVRSEDLKSSRLLASLIASLQSKAGTTTLSLEPLSEDASQSHVSAFLGRDEALLAKRLYALSEGNPFVLEESLRSLVASEPSGALSEATELALPTGVAASIRQRLSLLDSDQRRLLHLCALAGKRFSSDLIALSTDHVLTDTLQRLDELCRQSMLVYESAPDTPVPRFAFLHDRLRDVVIEDIDPATAIDIHLRIARSLDGQNRGRQDPEIVGALAHHFRAANRPERAIECFAELGEIAFRRYAPIDAAEAFKAALLLAPMVIRSDLAHLERRLGMAYYAAGKREAIAAFERAASHAREQSDTHRCAEALDLQGLALAADEQHEAAIAIWQQALDLLSGSDDSQHDRARILIHMADTLGVSLGRPIDALLRVREALTSLEAGGGDNPLQATALLALARTLMRSNRLKEASDVLDSALPSVVAAGRFDVAAEMEGAASNVAYWCGDVQKSWQCTYRRRDYARLAGQPVGNRHTSAWLALLEISQGNWAAATTLLNEADDQALEIDSPEPTAFSRHIRGHLAFLRGRWSEAWSLMEEALPAFQAMGIATEMWYVGYAARAAWQAGAVHEAEALEQRSWLLLEELPSPALSAGATLSQLAVLLTDQVRSDHAEELAERLSQYSGQFHWNLVDRSLAGLYASRGDIEAANRLLDRAIEAARRYGLRPEQALAQVQRTLLRGDQQQEAAGALTSLSMAGHAGSLIHFTAEKPGNVSNSPLERLSAREIEVLVLIAEGLTNNEIADRLGISGKTVTNHITHIFDKADLENRASAAAFAVRHGLS